MADRLRFSFIRVGPCVHQGEIAVDVLDPTNSAEIAEKLMNRKFAEYIVLDEDFDGEWSFQPIIDIDDEDN